MAKKHEIREKMYPRKLILLRQFTINPLISNVIKWSDTL